MRAFFSFCFVYWHLSFMISENTLPGLCQLACIWRTARYAAGLISRVLFVWLALKGVYHKLSWSIRDLCCLNLHVLLLLEVHSSITCGCHRFVGPGRLIFTTPFFLPVTMKLFAFSDWTFLILGPATSAPTSGMPLEFLVKIYSKPQKLPLVFPWKDLSNWIAIIINIPFKIILINDQMMELLNWKKFYIWKILESSHLKLSYCYLWEDQIKKNTKKEYNSQPWGFS